MDYVFWMLISNNNQGLILGGVVCDEELLFGSKRVPIWQHRMSQRQTSSVILRWASHLVLIHAVNWQQYGQAESIIVIKSIHLAPNIIRPCHSVMFWIQLVKLASQHRQFCARLQYKASMGHEVSAQKARNNEAITNALQVCEHLRQRHECERVQLANLLKMHPGDGVSCTATPQHLRCWILSAYQICCPCDHGSTTKQGCTNPPSTVPSFGICATT